MQWANSQTSVSTNIYTNPPNLENWVERKEEMETIKAWLNNPQITTVGITQANTLGIQGLGGVGKSSLAAYLYHALDFEAKFWADVSLKPDFTIFAEQAIKALGGKVSYPLDVTQLINNLLQLLSQHRCLLVVDNLETLLDNNRKWQDENYQQFFNCWQQQGINSTLLITTQEKPKSFQGLQQWYPLGGMKIEEGIDLLNKLAIKGTAEELKTFVEYVDGHPLTIKLVAGYLNEYCDSKLSQIIELGLEKFELAYQEAAGLHRNKQDARLAWIIRRHLNRLNPKQLEFLTNLSVYSLPFNREAASYMWIEQKATSLVIQKQLQELCNRSLLIKTGNNKFQFESLVYKFICKNSSNLAYAHQQAIRFYQKNRKKEEHWIILSDVNEYIEIANHLSELHLYLSANYWLRFCSNFLYSQGYYTVLIRIYEKLINKWKYPDKDGEYSSFAWILSRLGILYYYFGQVEPSISYHEASLKIYWEIKNLKGVASCLGNLGNTFDFIGKERQAFSLYHKAWQIYLQIGNLHGEANSLGNLGNMCVSDKEYQHAITLLEWSLEIQQKIEDFDGMAESLSNLGSVYIFLKEYETAIHYYQYSLDIKTKLKDLNGESASYLNLATCYYCVSNFTKAAFYYKQSLCLQQKICDKNNTDGSSISLAAILGLGKTYYSLKEYKQAIYYYEFSIDIYQKTKDIEGEANTYFYIGESHKKLQGKTKAKQAYEISKKLYQSLKREKYIKVCDRAIQELENTE